MWVKNVMTVAVAIRIRAITGCTPRWRPHPDSILQF
jgi:hypothetical protein